LCSKLKQFQNKLLRKWVQGLTEKRAAADMNNAPAANKHSNSSSDEEENGDKNEDTD
jgi:hypothetical protein